MLGQLTCDAPEHRGKRGCGDVSLEGTNSSQRCFHSGSATCPMLPSDPYRRRFFMYIFKAVSIGGNGKVAFFVELCGVEGSGSIQQPFPTTRCKNHGRRFRRDRQQHRTATWAHLSDQQQHLSARNALYPTTRAITSASPEPQLNRDTTATAMHLKIEGMIWRIMSFRRKRAERSSTRGFQRLPNKVHGF